MDTGTLTSHTLSRSKARRLLKWVIIICASYLLIGFIYNSYGRIGVASYYSKRFHGRKTASGERFDMYKLTAAHRTLPLGTKVKVTNLKNGKTVEVAINDRGPYKRGRIVDLSLEAARQIDMIKDGVAKVRLDIISKPSRK